MATISSPKQILVVGGGFGGIKAALELSKDSKCAVTLLSDQQVFRYYPALYHTATGGRAAQSHIPLREILDTNHVNVVQGNAQKIDRKAHTVTTEDGTTLPYDIAVLAMGSVANYFGIAGLEEYSYGVKSWEQIQRFKQHLHQQLTSSHQPDQNYVLVGAGPTGIEVAGALPAYLEKIMHNHGISGQTPRITIIEAAPRLLPRSSERVAAAIQKRLQKLGVDVRLGQKVEGETAEGLMVSGELIDSETVIWTAGTANHPFFKHNDFAVNERGKVQVDEFLRSEDDIYVIGDNAATQYSGVAKTALYDGAFVASDILRRLSGKKPMAYKPQKPIIIMPVGNGWASVEWGKFFFRGRLGWLLHEAAEWLDFHDLEPWWKAGKQMTTEFGEQEDCPTCIDK